MAKIYIQLNTENEKDRELLDIVNDIAAKQAYDDSAPLAPVLRSTEPMPAAPTGIAGELKQELDAIDAEATPSDVIIAPAPIPPVEDISASMPAPVPPTPLSQVEPDPSGIVNPDVVDKTGLPWDGRIHSRGKSKLANGCWKIKRGTDAALIASVEAQLRNTAPLLAPVPAPPAPAPMPINTLGPEITPPDYNQGIVTLTPPAPTPLGGPSVAPIPTPINPTPPAPVINPADVTFAMLLDAVVKAKLTDAQIQPALNDVNVASLTLLSTMPSLVPQVWSALCLTQ